MLDEEHVELVDVFAWNELFKRLVGLVRGEALVDQAKAARDPVYVGVYRHSGKTDCEQQDTGGGLGPHARKAPQPGFGLIKRKVAEEGEVITTDPSLHFLKCGLDPRGLDSAEAAGMDCIGHGVDRSLLDSLPWAKTIPEATEGAVGV
jgi:hypothetical protein